jgi:hypothetical protein
MVRPGDLSIPQAGSDLSTGFFPGTPAVHRLLHVTVNRVPTSASRSTLTGEMAATGTLGRASMCLSLLFPVETLAGRKVQIREDIM